MKQEGAGSDIAAHLIPLSDKSGAMAGRAHGLSRYQVRSQNSVVRLGATRPIRSGVLKHRREAGKQRVPTFDLHWVS